MHMARRLISFTACVAPPFSCVLSIDIQRGSYSSARRLPRATGSAFTRPVYRPRIPFRTAYWYMLTLLYCSTPAWSVRFHYVMEAETADTTCVSKIGQ